MNRGENQYINSKIIIEKMNEDSNSSKFIQK